MKIRIEIQMNNAAFADPELETAAILRSLAQKVEGGAILQPGSTFSIGDSNGNQVGMIDVM